MNRVQREKQAINTTLQSLYENTMLHTLANRINDINRIKEKSNPESKKTNNYAYEFENIIKRFSGSETGFVMKCVLDLEKFNELISICSDKNLTLHDFNKIILEHKSKLVYLNERYLMGSSNEKSAIIKPLIASIIDDVIESFHECVSDTECETTK